MTKDEENIAQRRNDFREFRDWLREQGWHQVYATELADTNPVQHVVNLRRKDCTLWLVFDEKWYSFFTLRLTEPIHNKIEDEKAAILAFQTEAEIKEGQ